MPTLRRSKSLNDKISRQKNRSGDVVRDPRSPDVEGRTRTCVDNFQALVHLRKQTEDKARQLELAFNYATNGHTYLRHRGPSGGVELPYPSSTPTAVTPTTAKSPTRHHHHPHPDLALDSKSKPPAAPRRQHSAEGRASSAVLRRQESLPENQASSSTSSSSTSQPHQSRRDQRRGGGARPMSMVEPLLGAGGVGAGGGLFPVQEELLRKEQVIQNLTENQRGLHAHNQKLLAKVDELEFENHRLRDLLNAQHVQQQFGGTYSPTQPQFPAPGGGGGGGGGSSRPHRSISLHGDALKVSAPPPSGHALVSPHSETSVSGYGSLADSPSGEGLVAGSPEARGVGPPAARTVGAGEVEVEDDDTLPLSGVSECSLEYRQDTLEKTSSSSSSSARTTSSSRASRAATLNSDRSDLDLTSGGGRRSKTQGSGEREGEPQGEGGCNPRIEELAKQVAELSSQRDTVILRFKLLLDDNFRVLKRDKRIQEELGTLIERHVKDLPEDLRSELQIVQEQLKDLNEDVQVEVQRALSALDTSSPGPGSKESVTPTMNSDDRGMLDRLVDLIGPDYRRLGRRLTVPQPELDSVEKDPQLSTCAHKTQAVLKTWLERRGGAGPADGGGGGGGGGEGSVEVPPAVRHLVQALRDVDKDLQHCQQSAVSGPERQALRNCLQLAIDHVMDPRDVLDHLIALNELSPAGIAFVQEVLEKRERAVCRLWHVAEYRGTGMVSRLALALDRSHCAQLAHRLRDELEIQNSRIHTQYRPSADDPPPASTPPPPVPAPVASPPLESCASASQARSRPMSRVPRLRSKTFDSVSHPVKASPAVEVPAVSAARKDKSKPLRPVSMAGPEKEAVPPQERPKSAVLKERVAPVVPEEKTAAGSKNNGRQTNHQQERRGLPVPRDRSFSPFHKNKPTLSQPREKPAADSAKERPLSPLAKDSDNKPDSAARNRPFSPFDKSSRPFSPFEKDKASRQFSPFEKDKPRRAFSPEGNKAARSNSPLDRQKLAATAAQHGKSGGLQTQRDRPFSPFQKSKPTTSFQKERIANSSTQRERANALAQSEKPAPPPVDESPAAQPSRDVLAVWDKRASAGSKLGAPPAYGARNTVVLEQGGKISRV